MEVNDKYYQFFGELAIALQTKDIKMSFKTLNKMLVDNGFESYGSSRALARGLSAAYREWENRIYLYEHDVLYAYSIPATYGLGGRFYLCLRWQIIPQLALYLRASETVYAQQWAAEHDRSQTRTDIHLLLRAKL